MTKRANNTQKPTAKAKAPASTKRTGKTKAETSGVGRPTKYKSDYCAQVVKLCILGATDKEIADFFGVAESTINLWKIEYSEFSESIKRGKIEADANVAASLFKRAIGFSHDDEKIFIDNGKPIRVKTKKQYPPDATSAIFWLKNRQPEKWRDSKVLQGDDEKPLVVSTVEERENRIKQLKEKLLKQESQSE